MAKHKTILYTFRMFIFWTIAMAGKYPIFTWQENINLYNLVIVLIWVIGVIYCWKKLF